MSEQNTTMMSAKEVFDQLAPIYDARFHRPIDLAENRVTFEILSSWRGRILDLGCGTGLYLEYCKPDDYVGLDVSPEMLKVAQAKFLQHRFIEGYMENLEMFDDSSFDVAISTFGSFSYCLNSQVAIDEMWRVLKPGGRIFIMACGKRYENRESHIAGKAIPIITWTPHALYRAFNKFKHLDVTGLSGLGESFPVWFPQRFLDWYTRIEMYTLGRLWPTLCYFQVITGIKPHV